MDQPSLKVMVIGAWRAVAHHIALGHAAEFSGPLKETLVFRRLRLEIERVASPSVRINGPDLPDQDRFNNWHIDLVCKNSLDTIALEGKFKTVGDGAAPDNRLAAFFDLHKLETYVDSGKYSAGLFLFLTNNRAYLRCAKGASHEFSTHHGRVYEAGVPLSADRSRNPMPLPLILTRRYVFGWETVIMGTGWHHLVVMVRKKTG